MPRRTIKTILMETLEDLSDPNFAKFRHQLMDRRAEPRIRRKAVEGKSCLEIADVMVSTFTEAKVVGVAEEILRDIGCNQEADALGEMIIGLTATLEYTVCNTNFIFLKCFRAERFIKSHHQGEKVTQ
uniref:Pyrin domain-containing protein n=1 Tax=Mastacembelus armatus TaxID=205130 RepID=A0A3Q3RZG0_9TELE